jgi:uncharacterized membrane protein YfcA
VSPAFTPTVAVLLVLLGVAVGAFGTLVGVGGGFLLAPVLLILYPHESPKTITAISLAVVFVNSVSGALAYGHQRRIDYRSGLVFGSAGVPGAIVGVLLVGAIPRKPFDAIFAIALLTVAVWLLLRAGRGVASPHTHGVGAPRELVDSRGRRYAYRVRLGEGAIFGALVGVLSSFLGVGGGIFQVPLMIGALGFPAAIATATSQFVLVIVSFVGTATHVLNGSFAHAHGLRRTLCLSAGVIVGAQVGARVSLSLSAQTIQRLLAIAILAVALRLGWAAAA